jgi:hypothetical protein
MKLPKALILLPMASAILFASAASALTIDFETGSGYAAGNLVGQPSTAGATTWTRTNAATAANVINVAAGIGVGGSQGIQGVGTGGGSNFVYYGFDTTNTDLGFTFDSASSVLSYSFQWRPTQALDGTSASDIFRFTIGSSENAGGNAALSLGVRNNGVFVAQDGTNARTQAGLFTTNTYATISGEINYATNTFTVFVNNTQQFTDFNGGSLTFNNAASNNAFLRIGNLSGGTTDHRTWNLDNISVIPEPSAVAAILGLGAFGLVYLRRRIKG